MADLRVDSAAVRTFAAAVSAHTSLVGAECSASGQALGSGLVQDALGNVLLVLTVLDQALAEGAGALAGDARASGDVWVATDRGMAARAV